MHSRVADAVGAVLPGVDVTVRQANTGLSQSAVTNETGQYTFPRACRSVRIGSKRR